MVKPARVPLPSVYHVMTSPSAIATFDGPELPQYRELLMVMWSWQPSTSYWVAETVIATLAVMVQRSLLP